MSEEYQYLTITELAARLRVKPKTIKNKMANGTFRKGVHFFSPKGIGPRFKWNAIINWLEGKEERATQEAETDGYEPLTARATGRPAPPRGRYLRQGIRKAERKKRRMRIMARCFSCPARFYPCTHTGNSAMQSFKRFTSKDSDDTGPFFH